MSDAIIIDTPEGIEAYRLLATLKGLEIEMRTQKTFGSAANPMTRGMALRSARRILREYDPEAKTPPRTRKQAHAALTDLLVELGLIEVEG